MSFFANNEPIDERDAIDRMAEELGLELPDVPATEDDFDSDLAVFRGYRDLARAHWVGPGCLKVRIITGPGHHGADHWMDTLAI